MHRAGHTALGSQPLAAGLGDMQVVPQDATVGTRQREGLLGRLLTQFPPSLSAGRALGWFFLGLRCFLLFWERKAATQV